MSTGRNTAIRDRHRKAIARNKPDCAYEQCLFPGEPIDYTAHHLDPRAFVADHRIPLNKGGRDTIDNKCAMHRACNREKSDRLPDLPTWTTGRTW